MARPVVGITTYVVPAKWSYWELEAALIPVDYVRAVERAGGRALHDYPLAVCHLQEGIGDGLVPGIVRRHRHLLDDAVLVSDQEAHAETFGIAKERDRAELALLQAALERDMPVLAICRGSQVLNVARGGDLVQHLPDVVGDEKHKHTPGAFADHDVTLEEGTRLSVLLGDRAPVKSHHHQGFGRVGEGLRVSAHAEDGTVEAVEDPSHRFALRVLWHPEAGEDMKLFEELVRQAGEYRSARAGSRP